MNTEFKLLARSVMVLMLLAAAPAWAQLGSDPDLNDDGVVDILDISLVGGCFGQDPATNSVCAIADRDGDGVIGADDINNVVQHYGETGFPIGNEDTVPPAVTIDSPVSDSLFNSPSVTVSGTVDDETANVSVNGQAVVVAGGTYTAAGISLAEGRNVISVIATDDAGNVGSASVQVTLDTSPPTVTVETPGEGAVLTSLQVDVAGLVNDIITGTTIDSQDCQVTVNGVEAEVSNRAWVVTDLLLQRGVNNLDVVASDRAGNTRHLSTQVDVQDQAGQRVVLLSGNNQQALFGSQLAEPLTVSLLDADGNPVAGKRVSFEVSRGDGVLSAFPDEGSRVFVDTDDNGIASVSFTVGDRMGAANHRVIATSQGFVGQVEFCVIALPGLAQRVTTLSGDHQIGATEQPLPLPLVVLVTDSGGNPVAGTDVDFAIGQGGGNFQGNATATFTTDSDGLASAVLTMGAQEGINNNIVTVSFDGLTESPAIFTASGRVSGQASETKVTGVVLDNQDNPVPGATVRLDQEGVVLDPVPTTSSDAQGRFTIANAPIGTLHLVVDGSTTSREGRWPTVSTEITTIPGQNNTIGQPVWLPQLGENQVMVQSGGPEEDVHLTMAGIPGAEVTIFAHSATCPDGAPECLISWSQVRGERVPMEPPLGSSFMLAWTLQPTNTRFDPPVAICIPNMELAPGSQTEMFSFDHDLGEFVAIGTATVTADGAQLCSDPGFGVVKAGWGGCTTPPPPDDCVLQCNDQNECTTDSVQDPPCKCNNAPTNEGGQCGGTPGVNACTEGVCKGGSCVGQKKPDGTSCDDDLWCTDPDSCASGACKGTKKPDQTLTDETFTFDEINMTLQKVQDWLDLLEIDATLPQFSGELTFTQKKVCCEEKDAMTLESTGGGKLTLLDWETPEFKPTIPPWSGNYEVSIFGRTVGVSYGVFIQASGDGGASLSRTKRECQDDVCWTGGIQISGAATGGVRGKVLNPLIPNECGDSGKEPCDLISLEGTGTSGLNAQFSVGCDQVIGQLGHNGFSVTGNIKVLEGSWFEFKASKTFVLLDPGPLGQVSFSLPQ